MSAAAGLLQGFHAVIAMTRDEPHWMLNDADAKRYGIALSNALKHIPIKAAQKTIDYSVLVVTAFLIETPRVTMSAMLAKQRAAQAKPGFRPQVVYPFPANPNPQQANPAQPSEPRQPGAATPAEGFTIEGEPDAPSVGP